jgi:hypothetical protein
MVCSLQVKRGFGAGIVAEASEILALHDADKLCIQAPPDAHRRSATAAQTASTSPNGQKSANRARRASGGEREDEPMAAILQRVARQHRGHREQSE